MNTDDAQRAGTLATERVACLFGLRRAQDAKYFVIRVSSDPTSMFGPHLSVTHEHPGFETLRKALVENIESQIDKCDVELRKLGVEI